MFGNIHNTNYLNDKHLIYLRNLNKIDSIENENNFSGSKINNENFRNLNNQFGICIYVVDYLFNKINEINNRNNNLNHNNKLSKNNFNLKLNYLEIYNEQVIDLLSEKCERSDPLLILEDPIKGIIIPDITQYKITEVSQVINLILLGNSRRTMAPTSSNKFSSRSHAILEFNIEQIDFKNNSNIISKFSLVDLAGSERGVSEKGIRRDEGSNINKSLLALGTCINILSDKNKKNSFVPYRDSKLTRLLKDSLGGNISTIMIACISPSILSYDETLNTLQYASRARNIQKIITKNMKDLGNSKDINTYKDIIDSLKTEVFQLKDVIR